ncbi:hypothetical protein [Streptomyces sp. enrichment culture]|uniref:hypothetical protein n=1 Tax=Streptomyces sp. enrichment culture TaxID=1795815 RepID=UPI003F54D4C1
MTPLSQLFGPTLGQTLTTSLETLNRAAAELRALTTDHQAALTELRDQVASDRDLSEEGRANRLRERTTALSEQAMIRLRVLRGRVRAAEEEVTRIVEAAWPEPAPGVEGMLGRQAAWARSRSLLESGIAVGQMIQETTDLETLFALRDELPTWVRAHGGDGKTVDQVRARIEQHTARLASEGGPVDLTAKYEARAAVAGLAPLLDHAETVLSGQRPAETGLSVAVAAQMARQEAQISQGPIIGPDGDAL